MAKLLRNEYFRISLLLIALLGLFFSPYILKGHSLCLSMIEDQWSLYAYYPWDIFIAESFRSGYFPLWNPFNALGTPFLANLLTSSIFLPKIFIYFSSNSMTIKDLYLLGRLFIAGFFTYVFLRYLMIGKAGSLFGSIYFMFSGYFTRYLNEGHLNVESLIPLLLFCFFRLGKRGGLGSIILCSFAVSLIILGGHPSSAFYALFFVSLFYFYQIFFRQRDEGWQASLCGRFCLYLGSVSLGFSLSLIQLLPFAEHLKHSWHLHPQGLGLFHYNIKHFISLILPWFFGDFRSSLLPGILPAWEVISSISTSSGYEATSLSWLPPYLGLFSAVFAVYSLINLKISPRWSYFFSAFLICFLGMIYGLPFFRLTSLLPIFRLSSNVRYAIPVLTLSLAVLGAVGFDILISDKFRRKGFNLSLGIIFFLIFGFCIAYFSELLKPLKADDISLALAIATGWLVAILLVFFLYIRSNLNKRIFVNITIGICFLAIFVNTLGYKPIVRKDLDELSKFQFDKYLKEDEDLFRIHSLPPFLFPNLGILFHLHDIRGMYGIYLKRYVKLINFVNNYTEEEGADYYIRRYSYFQPKSEKINSKFLDLLNLKYVLSYNKLSSEEFIEEVLEKGKRSIPHINHISKGVFLVKGEKKIVLFEHPPALIQFPIKIPPDGISLRFFLGLDPQSWRSEKGDGVIYELFAEDQGEKKKIFSRAVDPKSNTQDRRWIEQVIELSSFGDRTILLSLITSSKQNTDFDWAGWGEIHLEKGEQRWELAYEQNIKIYRNQRVIPRAFIVPEVEVVEEEDNILERISSEKFNPRKVAILEYQIPEINLMVNSLRLNSNPSAEIFNYQADSVGINTELEGNGFLILSDAYYPGWKVYVDGKEERIYRADYLLRAVPLSYGQHRVEFVFNPVSFKLGLWSSIITLFSLIGYLVCRRFLLPFGQRPGSYRKD
ncbi:MAG: YfhO family protein [Deltaproteobacteria bacterium]|nr:MAG: YfhO family protein [Deltaproteobacteria bacterium]